MSESGVKYDQGKPRVGLALEDFSLALTEVAKVTTFGAVKYSPSGWVSVENAEERYRDALYRHLLAGASQEADPESELPHLAHAAWNALAVLELRLRRKGDEGKRESFREILERDFGVSAGGG